MYCLKTQFNPHESSRIKFCQIVENIVGQTVWPGGYCYADYVWMSEGSFEFFAQDFYGSICVGMTLEISYVSGLRPFAADQIYLAL